MTLVPFPPRVPEPARTAQQLLARKGSPHPYCDMTITKDTRGRRYVLWPDAPVYFVGEVWFDRCRHGRKRVARILARMLANKLAREILDLSCTVTLTVIDSQGRSSAVLTRPIQVQ